jgi:hypothetical protein
LPPPFIPIRDAASVLAIHVVFLRGQFGNLSPKHGDDTLLGPIVLHAFHRSSFIKNADRQLLAAIAWTQSK